MKYQQLTHRLRFNMGPGTPDVVSERPMNRKREFLDGEEGTVVEIPAGAIGVDVAMLLRTGAIAVIPDVADSLTPTLSQGERERGQGSAAKESDGG